MPHFSMVIYPNEPDLQFDEEYYMKTHMPLVDQTWKSYGLTSWKVNKYTQALDGTPAKFRIAAHLVWENEEAMHKALKDPKSSKVFADIPNFTNVKPITLAGPDL
ncbi:uncharacterized protein N7459_003165 [Penicillium hispanicum]|uniref:uncharacterized protein n=1 Tax=Penicillium hispanicum TaxID=1080232 RepID=UPI00253FEAA1|nr:uncharacterized protein N7459_003165 [Penicillium hispanicum]KAJ5587400.1 hypothetical protein N7459_003165 [Penicillium hispanicum]